MTDTNDPYKLWASLFSRGQKGAGGSSLSGLGSLFGTTEHSSTGTSSLADMIARKTGSVPTLSPPLSSFGLPLNW